MLEPFSNPPPLDIEKHHYYKATPMIIKPNKPAPGIAPTSSLLQAPDGVAEATECSTLIDRGPDVPAEVVTTEPDDAGTSTVVVE